MTKTSTQFICVGVFSGVHGVRGQLKVKTFTESLDSFIDLEEWFSEDGKTSYPLVIKGQAKGQLIASLEGVDDRNVAEKMRGITLHVPREYLPEISDDESFYHEDLIGMTVLTTKGEDFGHVLQVQNHGAGDLLEIALPSGKSKDFIFNKLTFPEIDLAARTLTISPPEEIEVKAESENDSKPE